MSGETKHFEESRRRVLRAALQLSEGIAAARTRLDRLKKGYAARNPLCVNLEEDTALVSGDVVAKIDDDEAEKVRGACRGTTGLVRSR